MANGPTDDKPPHDRAKRSRVSPISQKDYRKLAQLADPYIVKVNPDVEWGGDECPIRFLKPNLHKELAEQFGYKPDQILRWMKNHYGVLQRPSVAPSKKVIRGLTVRSLSKIVHNYHLANDGNMNRISEAMDTFDNKVEAVDKDNKDLRRMVNDLRQENRELRKYLDKVTFRPQLGKEAS